MTSIYSTDETKRLALRYLLENIDYRRRCLYLQEIISLGRENKVFGTSFDASSPGTMTETSQ